MQAVHVDCPTYLELSLKNGDIDKINGKTLNAEGVIHVIDYLCQEVDVKAEDVLTKIASLGLEDGSVTLKLYNGAVETV